MTKTDAVLILLGWLVGRDLGRVTWYMFEARRLSRQADALEERLERTIMEAEHRWTR
jgi:hypothetical protein